LVVVGELVDMMVFGERGVKYVVFGVDNFRLVICSSKCLVGVVTGVFFWFV